jgi:DNA replication ATP-dependent helicase Dna2
MSASSAPLIRKRTFDYCILDEASQLTLPISLGPIFFANTFVLVGDPYQARLEFVLNFVPNFVMTQLPPLVKSPEAKQEGLDVSLFFYLSQTHPEAVVELDHQYRMNADIMTLSNRLIYDGKLRVGSAEVAQVRNNTRASLELTVL